MGSFINCGRRAGNESSNTWRRLTGCTAANELDKIVEYKNLIGHKSDNDFLVMEVPQHNNKLYNYKIKSEQEKYSIGRMGTYRYLNINKCIDSACELAQKI